MRIGVDLGGTKIEGIVLDSSGSICARQRIMTPRGDYPATVVGIRDLVTALERVAGLSKQLPVGVGIPGTVSPTTGLIKNANSTCLIGERLNRDLESALGRPVRLANDADCFAISEAVDGAGAGHKVVFGVILGTGVGGGIVVDGRLLQGPNAITGEWGHNPLPWPVVISGIDERPGPKCYCGREGCIETFLSGPGLAGDHERATRRTMDAAEIIKRASAHHGDAKATLDRYEGRLARALASVINLLDPDVIVLGGGLSSIERLYQSVPELWQTWVFSDRADTLLKRNEHGPASGVRGAAWLWQENEITG